MARFSAVQGDVVPISKVVNNVEVPLVKLMVGLGWDMKNGKGVDLDSFILQFDKDSHVLDTIYFGHKNSDDKAIKHMGDNLTGEGDGDDEQIMVGLDKVNPLTHKLLVGVNIYSSGYVFTDIKNAFVRLVNSETQEQVIKYDLSNEFGNTRTMILGEIVKNESGAWDFVAVGKGTPDRSISEMASRLDVKPQGEKKKGLFGGLFG